MTERQRKRYNAYKASTTPASGTAFHAEQAERTPAEAATGASSAPAPSQSIKLTHRTPDTGRSPRHLESIQPPPRSAAGAEAEAKEPQAPPPMATERQQETQAPATVTPSKLDTINTPADAQTPQQAPGTPPAADTISGNTTDADNDTTPTEGTRKHRSRTSSATKRAYNNRTYDNIQIQLATGSKRAIKDAAAAEGKSIAAYITAAINAYAGREIITPLQTNPYI